ncbi:N-terminal domain of NEFA-interacting nuclear protein NIP30-domain-containing protein [Obelidium mucronatum]|nr:N-terminal domain of NEFA-interacting nuclear protein NIP30-domain-containing protein [Obelidium mucronatum]
MNRFVSKGTVVGEQEVVDPAQDQSAVPDAPYVPPDNRTLYEKLQSNKLKKEEEFAEKTKLANLIKKLDADEIEFLHAQHAGKRAALLERDAGVAAQLAAFRATARELADDAAADADAAAAAARRNAAAFAFSASAAARKPRKPAAAPGGGGGLAVVAKRKRGDDKEGDVIKEGVLNHLLKQPSPQHQSQLATPDVTAARAQTVEHLKSLAHTYSQPSSNSNGLVLVIRNLAIAIACPLEIFTICGN